MQGGGEVILMMFKSLQHFHDVSSPKGRRKSKIWGVLKSFFSPSHPSTVSCSPETPLSKTQGISIVFNRAAHVPWVWAGGFLNLLPKPKGSSRDTRSSHRFAGLCQRWEISSFLVSALIPKVRNGSISAPISRHMNNKANGFWSSAKMPACVYREKPHGELGSGSWDPWVRAKETSAVLPLQSGPGAAKTS